MGECARGDQSRKGKKKNLGDFKIKMASLSWPGHSQLMLLAGSGYLGPSLRDGVAYRFRINMKQLWAGLWVLRRFFRPEVHNLELTPWDSKNFPKAHLMKVLKVMFKFFFLPISSGTFIKKCYKGKTFSCLYAKLYNYYYCIIEKKCIISKT